MKLATRGSALALWQAEHVRGLLLSLDPGLEVALSVVRTTGDRIADVPLSRIGGRGLFTKEVDEAVLSGEADAAVHSLKDLATRLQPGLSLAAVLEREDPLDALVVAPGRPRALRQLVPGSVVGTSSLRRRSQILHARPDLRVVDLRGNLGTRLERVRRGDFDAAVLACAGLIRLGHEDAIAERLGPPDWLPAAGQGALALVIREGDGRAADLARRLEHAPTRLAVTAERALLHRLEGGCQVPIGALGAVVGDGLRLQGLIASLDGHSLVRGERSQDGTEAERLGDALAEELLARGGAMILDGIRTTTDSDLPRPSPP